MGEGVKSLVLFSFSFCFLKVKKGHRNMSLILLKLQILYKRSTETTKRCTGWKGTLFLLPHFLSSFPQPS